MGGCIEAIKSEEKANSYLRLNGFYSLPLKSKGHSFLELYTDNKGYFGKTTLSSDLIKGSGPVAQIAYINEPFTKVGLGINLDVPFLKKAKASLKLQAYPVWINKEMKINPDEFVIGYGGSIKLPKGFSVGSFGQINIDDASGKPTWCYGEASLQKSLGKCTLAYNPALRRKVGIKPKVEHRVSASYNF